MTKKIVDLTRDVPLTRFAFFENQVGNAAIPLLAAIGAGLTIGLWRALRMRTLFAPVFILTALVVLSLNYLGVLYPKDLIRETAVAVLLLPAVVAERKSAVASGAAGQSPSR